MSKTDEEVMCAEAEVNGIKTSYERQLACLAVAQKGVDSLAKSLAEAKLNLARAKGKS